MDSSSESACDLKSFYRTKKTPHSLINNLSPKKTSLHVDDESGYKLGHSVVTIDLSDDSLIEASDFNEVNNNKNTDYSGDRRLSISSDDSVDTLVSSPVKDRVKVNIPTKQSYNFLNSDDDSFLDIPLSQRIGLESKVDTGTNKKSNEQTEENVKESLNWLDDEDSIGAWTTDLKPSDTLEACQYSDKDVSPFKQPVTTTKKIEKRPYQSDTPPNKSYTSLKEKNPKSDPPSTSVLSDEEAYRIEDTITPVRKRRTPEEIQKLKEEKERRKAERAEEKRAKDKMKMKEKEKKATLKEAGRTKLLADCHKFCKTYVDISLLDKYKIMDELQSIFKEKEAPLILDTNNPIDLGIRWVREQREIIEEGTEEERVVNLLRKDVDADIILKVLNTTEFIPFVNLSFFKIELESSDDEFDGENSSQTLFEYVTALLDTYDGFGSVGIQEASDVTSLWVKQLMSFTKMSLEMAKAVAEVYPCLQSLLKAYKQCSNPDEMENLLGSIQEILEIILHLELPQMLGPQCSRRIYQFFTTRDGDAIID